MTLTHSRDIGTLSTIQAELAPFPGRLAGSLRDTLGIVIALVLAMTLRVPGIALALTMLFLLQRDRPGLTLRSAAQMLSGAATACVATLCWVQLTDGTDVARFLGMILGMFVAAFGMATTSIPLFFTVFGFYGFLYLSLWDTHQSPNHIVSASLYNVASLAVVVLSAVGVESLFGIHRPEEKLQREMRKHLSILSRFFHALAEEDSPQAAELLRSLHSSLVQSAHLGAVRMNELYNRLRNTSPTLATVPIGLHYRIGLLVRVLERSSVIGFRIRQISERDKCVRECYATIAAQCDRLIDPHLPVIPEKLFLAPCSPWLIDIYNELQLYQNSLIAPQATAAPPLPETPQARPSLRQLLPAAFQSAEQVPYALKLTLAATLCYTIYNAIDWPGIHTCVITVLFTGLSPTGQMKQRQTYRFVGTAIGAFFTIAAETLLFPNMDSITALVCVVAAVAFISGWVLRSPHIGSVGIQIGFAFFLTTLPEFRATTQISTAGDRVIGVALGSIIMWFIFDQIWPTRTSQALNRILHRIQHAASLLHQVDLRHKPAAFAKQLSRLRVTVSLDLASMQQLESAAYFDFGRGHLRELAKSRRLVRRIEAAASEFYTAALHQTSSDPAPQPQTD